VRRLLVTVALFLGVVFILLRLAEVQAIGETLKRGDWRYLLLAIMLEAFWLMNVAGSYWTIYRTIGLKERFNTLLLATSGANFVNIIAPAAGASGMAVFISTARKRGYSPARVTIAGIVYLLFDYAGLMVVLAAGLAVLVRRHILTPIEITGTAVLLLIALSFASLLILGLRSTETLERTLIWLARLANRFGSLIHRQLVTETRVRDFAREFSQGIQEARNKPEELIFPAILALTNKALLITIFFLVFRAFQVPLSIGTLIAGFSIGYLFWIVSPTPAGVGLVEGALTIVLSSLYIPLSAATVVALAFRGITFWIPLAFGGFALRLLEDV